MSTSSAGRGPLVDNPISGAVADPTGTWKMGIVSSTIPGLIPSPSLATQERGEEVLVLMPAKYTDDVIPNHIRKHNLPGISSSFLKLSTLQAFNLSTLHAFNLSIIHMEYGAPRESINSPSFQSVNSLHAFNLSALQAFVRPKFHELFLFRASPCQKPWKRWRQWSRPSRPQHPQRQSPWRPSATSLRRHANGRFQF